MLHSIQSLAGGPSELQSLQKSLNRFGVSRMSALFEHWQHRLGLGNGRHHGRELPDDFQRELSPMRFSDCPTYPTRVTQSSPIEIGRGEHNAKREEGPQCGVVRFWGLRARASADSSYTGMDPAMQTK